MREFPIFVPAAGEHLAAVVTVPEGRPRALVLLTQGGNGAPRSYFNATWTTTARSLADRGFASVRLEWPGIGDSTGVFRMRLSDPPVEEVGTVLRTVIAATGIERLGLAAECGGATAALALTDELEGRCESAAVIKLTLPGTRLADPRSRAKRGRLLSRLRRHPHLDRLLRRTYWRIRMRRMGSTMEQLADLRRRGPVLLLDYRVDVKLMPGVAMLQRRYGVGEFQVEEVPFEGPMGLPDRIGREAFISSRLVAWFDETLPGASPDRPAGPTPHAAP